MTAPWLFLVSLLAGLGIEFVIPAPLASGNAGLIVGTLLVVLGFATVVWSGATFRRMKTSVLPDAEPSMFVEKGPFRWSRNPMYLGLALLHLGLGCIINSAWIFGFSLLALMLVDRAIVPREEALLRKLYPEAYQQYAHRVRRWL